MKSEIVKTITREIESFEYKGMYIRRSAFAKCMNLRSVNLPNAEFVGSWAFGNCYSLQTVSIPRAVYLDDYAFFLCKSLASITSPSLTRLGSDVFTGCERLTSVSLPNLVYIGDLAFQHCDTLAEITLPKVEIVGNGGFVYCSMLSTVTLGQYVKFINFGAFESCSSLLSLYLNLGGTAVPKLMSVNAFAGTPMYSSTVGSANRFGSIFVPASLVTAYKTADNWSFYSDRIVGT